MTRVINYKKIFMRLAENKPDHNSFSPSSSDKWLNCMGFYKATKDLPATKSGKAAQRGTKAHALMERCMLDNVAPEDISTDIEMNEWVNYVLDYVTQYKILHPKAEVFPEVYLPWLHVSGGTIDVFGVSPEELLILDLKTGSWAVEVEDNTQLLSYAVAARFHVGKKKQYRLVIVQPGGFHSKGPIRETIITDKDLNAYEEYATSSIVRNLVGGERIPGDHCKWCKAEAICIPKANYVLEQAELKLKSDFLEDV